MIFDGDCKDLPIEMYIYMHLYKYVGIRKF